MFKNKVNAENYLILIKFQHMKYNQLSEEKMLSLVLEGVEEAINELSTDEGLGRFLGSATQWARNKLNNFKADFKAGQNAQRWQNRDYDPYARYGDEGDKMRNFGGPEYGAYRYNKTVERNAAAPHYTRERVGKQNQEQGKQQQAAPAQQSMSPSKQASQSQMPRQTKRPQQQQRSQRTSNQGQKPLQNGISPNPDLLVQNDNDIVRRAENMTDIMSSYGLEPVYSKQDISNGHARKGATPVNWKSKNGGKITHQQRQAIQQWAKYKLQEQRKEISILLNEQFK